MLFEGLFIPYVTPFNEQGALDEASLVRLAEFFTAIPGVAGLVSCARIGEGPVLTLEEKEQVYRTVGDVARRNGKQHIATIAPQSTDEAIDIVRDLETLAVDAAMIFPPLLLAWGRVEGELKFRFWEDIGMSTSLPLVLFQIPVRSYWYDVPTIGRISQLDSVVAMKEASFDEDLYTRTVQEVVRLGNQMTILSGNDKFVGRSYELGGRGALIGISNLATAAWAELDRAGRSGDIQTALAIQTELSELSELVFAEPIVEAVSRIKLILRHQDLIDTARVRRPQLGVSAAEEKVLLSSYEALCQKRKVA